MRMNFKLEFTTLIDKNEQLSDSRKLHYLRLALKNHVKQLQNTDYSYASLFKALKMFENKILIFNKHVSPLLNNSKIQFQHERNIMR